VQGVQIVVVDEADECWQAQHAALEVVLAAAQQQQEKPTMVFSGATLGNDLVCELKERGWLPYATAIEGHAKGALPAGLNHRCDLFAFSGEPSVQVQLHAMLLLYVC
jgi:hypothetical protein